MDDLEFSARAHANPDDMQQDFIAALSGRADRQQMLDEIRLLNNQLKLLSDAVEVPEQLRQKLRRPPENPSWALRGAYAIAATLVLAVGFVVSSLPYRPSAEEIAMHDSMIEHLMHEEPRYAEAQPIQWSEVEAVLAAANISMQAPSLDEEKTLIITFANLCRLGGERRAVHLVAMGEHGPVSVLLIHSPPVGGDMDVQDDRFKGRIKAASAGNVAVVGEKNENLERFESLVANTVQWSL